MTRRRRSGTLLQLDSLSDIMTCAVGIVLFMMIQAVLTGNALVVQRDLPKFDPKAQLEPAFVLCQGGQVVPLHLKPLVDRMIAQAPPPSDYNAVGGWCKRWERAKVSDDVVEVTGYAGYLETSLDWFSSSRQIDAGIKIAPKPGVALDTIQTVANPDSRLVRYLQQQDHNQQYVHFIVDPTSIDLLEKVTKVAREQGFRIGWEPGTLGWPLRISGAENGGGEGDKWRNRIF